MADFQTFKITEAFFPNVFEGYQFRGDEKPTFGVSIKAEELPDNLRPFARRPKESMGHNIITITAGKLPPVVVTPDNRHGMSELESILRFADTANIPRDRLLQGIPMELSTLLVEFEEGWGGRVDRSGTTLFLKAIKVAHTDLLRRYDECCAQYFTGA